MQLRTSAGRPFPNCSSTISASSYRLVTCAHWCAVRSAEALRRFQFPHAPYLPPCLQACVNKDFARLTRQDEVWDSLLLAEVGRFDSMHVKHMQQRSSRTVPSKEYDMRWKAS